MASVGMLFGRGAARSRPSFANALRYLPWTYAACWVAALAWFPSHDAQTGSWTGRPPQPVTRAEEPRLWNLLENLCISRGMRIPRLAVIETGAMNAFASGLTRDKGAVTVTRGLVEGLDDRELAAVLAHELSHIRNGDARLGLIAAVFVGIISLGFDMMTRRRRTGRVARRGGWRVEGNSRNGPARRRWSGC